MKAVWYKGVDVTSATLTDLGENLSTSSVRIEQDGKRYRLFKNGTAASATLAGGVTIEASGIGTDNVVTAIIYTTVATSQCVGVTRNTYNGSATTIPGDHYFWAQIGGLSPTVTGTVTIGRAVYGGANDGEVLNTAGTNIIGYGTATISASTGRFMLTLA